MRSKPLTREQKARILHLAGQASLGWIARAAGCTKGQVAGVVWRVYGPVHAASDRNLRPRGPAWQARMREVCARSSPQLRKRVECSQ